MDIKECISHLNQTVSDELHGIKKLKGSKLEKFKEVFYIETEEPIYYNDFNIIITSKELRDYLLPYLKQDNLIATFEAPQSSSFFCVYSYFNDQIFSTYL